MSRTKALSEPSPRSSRDSSWQLIDIIRRVGGATRGDLLTATRLARGTLTTRLVELQQRKLIELGGVNDPQGGRPAERFQINRNYGLVAGIDAGATRTVAGIATLDGELVDREEFDFDIAAGPKAFFDKVQTTLATLLRNQRNMRPLLALCVGLPGPVDQISGSVVDPPIMPGWHGVPLLEAFEYLSVPVVIENDVNLRALAEHRLCYPDQNDLLVLKFSTGFGAGIIIDGHILRGHRGGAGDIGHLQIDGSDAQCQCGKRGCVEAMASGWAFVREMKKVRPKINNVRQLVGLMHNGDELALDLLRNSCNSVGRAVSDVVSILNPKTVVVGGLLTTVDDFVLDAIRQSVFERSTSLATKDLRVERSHLGSEAGVLGAVSLAIDQAFNFANFDNLLQPKNRVAEMPQGTRPRKSTPTSGRHRSV